MLKDSPRNEAYRQAIFDNADQIKGRVVLDVGAGTGILSIFCAQVGASKVYAVEASDVYKIAQEVVKENNFENVIEVMNAKIEDVSLPEKVDVIVSEWMGFYLLHEGMLDSVLFARDRFLKDGGLIFPESATIYAAPCSVPQMFDYWNNVSGIQMSTFAQRLRHCATKKPITSTIPQACILAEPEAVLWIDLREITSDDVNSIKVEQLAVVTGGKYQGLCLWFTCSFPSFSTEPVVLSTAPDDPPTHWKQTTIVLPSEVELEPQAPVAYKLSLERNRANGRRWDIEMEVLDPQSVEHPEYCTCHMTKCILTRAVLDKYESESRENK